MAKALFHLRQFRLLLLVLLYALFSLPLGARGAYVLQSEDQHTLTFYYDNNRKSHGGKTWDIDEKSSSSSPVWAGAYYSPNDVVTKVVFDASFKDFRPTTTKSWFYNLKALTTIEGLENLNTSEATNMGWMFYGCSSLKELNVSNFNTSKVTAMSALFAGCSGLTSLNVSNFNTSKVTNMSMMFNGCSGLKELNVSNFNTSKVTAMSALFAGCSGLTSLNVSNFNTSAVTSMYEMFRGCSGLTSLNVSKFNTSKVTDMRGMFSYCSGLKELKLSYFNTSEVTDMGGMFSYCYSLKRIFNTKTWRCKQSQDMFKGCNQLTGAVKYNESKVDATMANPTTGYFTDTKEAYVLQSEDQHTLTFYYDNNRYSRSGKIWDIDEKKYENSAKNEEVPAWAGTYGSLNGVTKVVFDASFKDFRPTTTEHWFYYLSALTTIEDLQNLNTSEVTDMSAMFFHCSSLTSLNLSNFNTSAVTNMSHMFSYCYSLKRIFNTQTWRCEQSYEMFKGCSHLKGAVKYDASKFDVTMANPETGYFSDPNKTYLEAYVLQSEDQHTLTFYYDDDREERSGKTWGINKNELYTSYIPGWAGTDDSPNNMVTEVVFDASFKYFRPTTTNSWFSYLETLTTIEGLENLNTSEVTNMLEMFYGCSRLTSLNLSNFNTSKVENMYAMFAGCSSLTSLNVSNFNTSKVWNMVYMFSGCSSLKTILNPNTWRSAGSADMFAGCTQLKGAVKYDASKLDVTMANPETGYFRNPNKKW